VAYNSILPYRRFPVGKPSLLTRADAHSVSTHPVHARPYPVARRIHIDYVLVAADVRRL